MTFISGLPRGFGTCCLRFTNGVATVMQDSLPAAWLAFAGRELNPLNYYERFPSCYISFPIPGFILTLYGWKAGFPSGAFLDDQRLKPALGVRRPTSSLLPPFVRLVVSTIVPLGVGSPTRLRTAVEVITPPPQGPSAQVRVIVSRTVITYSASVPLAGTSRFHRMAAYTRCLRCAGAPKRPPSGSGLSLPIPS